MDIQWDKHAKFLSGHRKLGHGPVERNVNLFSKNELDLHFFLNCVQGIMSCYVESFSTFNNYRGSTKTFINWKIQITTSYLTRT